MKRLNITSLIIISKHGRVKYRTLSKDSELNLKLIPRTLSKDHMLHAFRLNLETILKIKSIKDKR